MADLLTQLHDTTEAAWLAGDAMEAVGRDCKTKRGESLYDRVVKCESSLQEWDRALKKLQQSISSLTLVLPDKPNSVKAGSPEAMGFMLADVLLKRHDEMRSKFKVVRKEFDGYKSLLRGIKAK